MNHNHADEAEEFGMATESQNCVAEAQVAAARLTSEVIEQGSGPFKVVAEAPYYCRATDALVGSYVCAIYAFPTAEEAEAKLAALTADSGPEDEVLYTIEGRPEVAQPLAIALADDDIPF